MAKVRIAGVLALAGLYLFATCAQAAARVDGAAIQRALDAAYAK
jgi:hypothetical protein